MFYAIFIIFPYIIYKHLYENNHCWMDVGDSNWFLGIPVLIVILLNIIFMVNIIYILRSKLKTEPRHPIPENVHEATVKQARAILFLLPILGVNYLIVPIRPAEGSLFADVYHLLVAMITTLQGAFVSCLLCFTNSDVIAKIRRKWKQRIDVTVPDMGCFPAAYMRSKENEKQKPILGLKRYNKQKSCDTASTDMENIVLLPRPGP